MWGCHLGDIAMVSASDDGSLDDADGNKGGGEAAKDLKETKS